MKQLMWVVVGLSCACGSVQDGGWPGQDGGLELATTQQALSAGEQCQSMTGVPKYTGVPYAYSPASYGTSSCYKGYVVDVDAYSSGDLSNTFVSWADHRIPATQAECEDIRVAAYVWERLAGGATTFLGSRSKAGVWDGTSCEVPALRVLEFAALGDGRNYRFAVQARDHVAAPYSTREVAVTNVRVWSNGSRTAFSKSGAGTKVAFEGSTAVVGGPNYINILEKVSDTWVSQLSSSSVDPGGFGTSIAAAGQVVAAGRPTASAGSDVLVFTRTGGATTWTTTPGVINEREPGSEFGAAVAMQSMLSGPIRYGLVVGAPGKAKAYYFRAPTSGVFPETSTWTYSADSPTETEFGRVIQFNNPYVFFGLPGLKKVYIRAVFDNIYKVVLTTDDTEKLPGSNKEYRQNFGKAIAATDHVVLIASDFGVYAYTLEVHQWIYQGRVVSRPLGGVTKIAANSTHLFVGEPSVPASGGGVMAFFFGQEFRHAERRFVAQDLPSAGFGTDLAASDTELLVGAPTEKALHAFALPIPCNVGSDCPDPDSGF